MSARPAIAGHPIDELTPVLVKSGPPPTYHFNSIIPVLLSTGAVTFGNHIFVRRHFIREHHRAHEEYHAWRSRVLGTLGHLWSYLSTMARLLVKTRCARMTVFNRKMFAAYFLHPEEQAASRYADDYWHLYRQLGISNP